MSEEEILKEYPHLTKEDIHACLRYAADSYKMRFSRFGTMLMKFKEFRVWTDENISQKLVSY